MASNSKNLGELLNTTSTVSPAFVSDQDNTSTGYFDLPNGTTAQRPSAASGMIRYNTTTSLAEYYDGNAWKGIDSPPVVSSISPTVETDANANIVVTGSNFSSSVTAKFIGSDGTEYASPTVTRNSSTQVTMTTPSTALTVANEPYDIVVTNASSLSGTLADALDAGGVPAFDTAAGSLGTIGDALRVISGTTLDASATDPDGDTITYSVTTGSLPAGLSISSSTGMITGTATAVGSNTTTTFTVSAATASDTSTRQFSITISAPVITSYTSTGSGTFSVPSGTTAVNVLLVGAGGGGGRAGGGGAGGLIYRPAFPVTPGGSVSYTIGGGGQGQFGDGGPQNPGQNSTFGSLTALGGGGGSYSAAQGGQGGSGGGAGFNLNAAQASQAIGAGQQPSAAGDSGTYGFGNPGGEGGPNPTFGSGNTGGGGGGAGAKGGTGIQHPDGTSNWAQGGIGKQYAISGSQVYYAGGGSGAGHPSGDEPGSAAQGGGGRATRASTTSITIATANRGGGGGADHTGPNQTQQAGHGTGGSGIVIVSY